MKCVICKKASTKSGTTTVTFERDCLTMVVKCVPAQICPNCGEAYISEKVTSDLLKDADPEMLQDLVLSAVNMALDPENLVFELHQTTALQTQFPKPARSKKEIHMRQPLERWNAPHHAETRLKQRLVVALAVVRNQHIKLLQVLVERVHEAGFLGEVAHEELPDTKSIVRDPAHPDQKRVSAGAGCQSGGFGIQERPAGRFRRWDAAL